MYTVTGQAIVAGTHLTGLSSWDGATAGGGTWYRVPLPSSVQLSAGVTYRSGAVFTGSYSYDTSTSFPYVSGILTTDASVAVSNSGTLAYPSGSATSSAYLLDTEVTTWAATAAGAGAAAAVATVIVPASASGAGAVTATGSSTGSAATAAAAGAGAVTAVATVTAPASAAGAGAVTDVSAQIAVSSAAGAGTAGAGGHPDSHRGSRRRRSCHRRRVGVGRGHRHCGRCWRCRCGRRAGSLRNCGRSRGGHGRRAAVRELGRHRGRLGRRSCCAGSTGRVRGGRLSCGGWYPGRPGSSCRGRGGSCRVRPGCYRAGRREPGRSRRRAASAAGVPRLARPIPRRPPSRRSTTSPARRTPVRPPRALTWPSAARTGLRRRMPR